MNIKEYAIQKAKSRDITERLVFDKRYRMIAKAVFSLIFNLLFAFYNGILGILSSSVIFSASSVYFFLLSTMRFIIVTSSKDANEEKDRRSSFLIGVMLIVLSIILHIVAFFSIKDNTAALYGTITMITIATFTFSKITAAIITAVKHRRDRAKLFRAVNAIRYSEVAVSLLTMQQSMIVSFGEGNDSSALILNTCTGAGVCMFIFILGVITIKNSGKENKQNG